MSTLDSETMHILSRLDTDFYSQNAESFSATRTQIWPGWEHVIDLIASQAQGSQHLPIHVLDLACGNLRFEKFVEQRLGDSVVLHAVDNCRALAASPTGVDFQDLDIVDALLDSPAGCLDERLTSPLCDTVASFGFMHHIPGESNRASFMRAMLGRDTPGGYCIVSLWRFASSPERRVKAEESTAHALAELGLSGLEDGDYILGWQGSNDAMRYCHSFSPDEIDLLAANVSDIAEVVDIFDSDGREGNLNRYLVLRKL